MKTSIKVALIGGAAAVVAAVATPVATSMLSRQPGSTASGASVTQSTAWTATSAQGKTSLPPVDGNSGDLVTPSMTASSQPTSILAPQGQDGFTQVWQGQLVIGLSGVNFTSRGAQSGTASGNEDMTYQDDGNWSNNDVVAHWQSSFAPRPGDCLGLSNASNKIQLSSAPQVGDRYCAVPVGEAVVAYMQVISVDANGVHVVCWVWRPNV
jgi:hypothetical protein